MVGDKTPGWVGQRGLRKGLIQRDREAIGSKEVLAVKETPGLKCSWGRN